MSINRWSIFPHSAIILSAIESQTNKARTRLFNPRNNDFTEFVMFQSILGILQNNYCSNVMVNDNPIH